MESWITKVYSNFLILLNLTITYIFSSPKLSSDDLISLTKNSPDPFHMVEKDLATLSGCIKELLGSDHPVLESCAK
jgi:hypothetical protein